MAATSYLELLRESSLHPLAGVSGLVPNTRMINTTGPLTGGGSLNSDLTLGVNVTPGLSTVLVGQGRTITGVGAVQINGVAAASATLAADVTIGVNTFTGFGGGLVPGTSGGNAAKFLNGAGSWVTGTIAGVSSLSATLPATISPAGPFAIGDITIGVDTFSSVASGAVPASGGGTANFLRADGNWVPFGTGNFVRLQSLTPGTPDTGHSNISGTAISGRLEVNSQATPIGMVHVVGDGSSPEFMGASYSSTRGPSLKLRRSRGTESAPTVCSDGDELGVVTLDTRLTGSWLTRGWLSAFADGGGGATQSTMFDMYAGALSGFLQMRASSSGLRIEGGRSTISSVKAVSTIDLQGSMSFKTVSKTGNYTVTANDFRILCDGTGGGFTVTLPSASSLSGRTYEITKVDGASTVIKVAATSISGVPSIPLTAPEDSITVASDGTNWWMINDSRNPLIGQTVVDSTAIANNAGKQAFNKFITIPANRFIALGSSFIIEAAGTFSNTGSPTINFFISDTGGGSDFASSGAFATPSGVTGGSWQLRATFAYRTVGNLVSPVLTAGIVAVADASGVITFHALTASGGNTSTQADTTYGIQVQWGTASASNTITMKSFAVYTYGNGARTS